MHKSKAKTKNRMEGLFLPFRIIQSNYFRTNPHHKFRDRWHFAALFLTIMDMVVLPNNWTILFFKIYVTNSDLFLSQNKNRKKEEDKNDLNSRAVDSYRHDSPIAHVRSGEAYLVISQLPQQPSTLCCEYYFCFFLIYNLFIFS